MLGALGLEGMKKTLRDVSCVSSFRERGWIYPVCDIFEEPECWNRGPLRGRVHVVETWRIVIRLAVRSK